MPDMLSHHWAWAAREGGAGIANWSAVGRHYYLDKAGVVQKWPTEAIGDWAKWYVAADRVVHVTRCVTASDVPVVLSTIFTAYDLQSAQSRAAGGLPILWETLVFGGLFDGKCQRYSKVEEALAGHERWYNRIMGIAVDASNQSRYGDNDVAVAWAEPQPVPKPVEDDKPQWRKARTLKWERTT